MSLFKTTNLNTYATNITQLTQDEIEWNKLSHASIVKEHTEINYVDACPSSTQLAAVSVGPKVVIYNCFSARVVSTISRFSRPAHGATYRQDGQLLVAGSDDSHVHLFDTRNNDQLRVFKGHQGPVRRVKFITGFPPRIVSFSDDKTCGIWDISDEKRIMELKGHTDFVRAGCVSPSSPHLVASGSDDRTVRLWDTRTGTTVTEFDHVTAHVNDILCYPNGSLLATAAGNEVRIWDMVAGKLLSKMCRHHRDITSLCLAGSGTRLVSGSLDRHLKFYDTSTCNVVHTIDCPAAVLSFAVTPEDKGLVIGMIAESKGLISLQRKVQKKVSEAQEMRLNIPEASSTVKIIEDAKVSKLKKCDFFLKNFQHTDLLRIALNKRPAETVALLAELVRVGGMQSAIAGNDETLLKPLMAFLDKNISHPSYESVLLNIVSIIVDVYADKVTADSFIAKRLVRLYDQQLTHSIGYTREILNLEDEIDVLEADDRRNKTRNTLIRS